MFGLLLNYCDAYFNVNPIDKSKTKAKVRILIL